MRDRVFQHKCQNQKHQKYPISHVMGVGVNQFNKVVDDVRCRQYVGRQIYLNHLNVAD